MMIKGVDGRDIGVFSGLAFGKPKDRLRDAVLRTAVPGHDGGESPQKSKNLFLDIAPYHRYIVLIPTHRGRLPEAFGWRSGEGGACG